MKHLLILLAFALAFTSCADKNKNLSLPPTTEVYDSFMKAVWH